ncbi:MAG: Rib/alpha-like domain-containing protein, partial [Finegoldia magna]
SIEDKSVKDKSNQIKENDNETIASSEKKSQADLFAPEIKEIEVVQNGTIDYKEAIMNIPEGTTLSPSGEINTAELGKHTINVEIIFADGSSKP